MRIVAWNLGHMVREKPISPLVLDMIAHLAPDVLILNEYVHGTSRDPFVAGLNDLGLMQCCQSERVGKNNQVLVASRRRFRRGELNGPVTTDNAGGTNFLHVVMEDTPLEIVGLRVPTYSGSTQRAYWDNLEEIVLSVRDRRMVFVGDLNADPDSARHFGSRYLRRLEESGWHLPRAEGEWSCETRTLRHSRIDHAVISPLLGRGSTARYEVDLNGARIVSKGEDAASDHAALVVELATR
jgi:endonuclease/exonuclease/phosphatase (EEP) superfamily protein YafD